MAKEHLINCLPLGLSMSAKSLQSCSILCDPMGCSLPGSSVHGILQARILEWVAMPSSRGSSPPWDQTRTSCISCTEALPQGQHHNNGEPKSLSGDMTEKVFYQCCWWCKTFMGKPPLNCFCIMETMLRTKLVWLFSCTLLLLFLNVKWLSISSSRLTDSAGKGQRGQVDWKCLLFTQPAKDQHGAIFMRQQINDNQVEDNVSSRLLGC